LRQRRVGTAGDYDEGRREKEGTECGFWFHEVEFASVQFSVFSFQWRDWRDEGDWGLWKRRKSAE
jgi:hypothetical protein